MQHFSKKVLWPNDTHPYLQIFGAIWGPVNDWQNASDPLLVDFLGHRFSTQFLMRFWLPNAPFWAPFWHPKRLKNYVEKASIFCSVLGGILVPFWLPKWSQIGAKIEQKKHQKKDAKNDRK